MAPGKPVKFLQNFSQNVAEIVIERGTVTVDLLNRFGHQDFFLPIPPSIADGLFFRGVRQLEVRLFTNAEAGIKENDLVKTAIAEAVTASVRSLLLFRLTPKTLTLDSEIDVWGKKPSAVLSITDEKEGKVRLDIGAHFPRFASSPPSRF
jgi:hypothetical protein